MSVTAVANLFSGAIYYILLVSMPALLVAVVVGLIISIFQDTTTIQEQTLTFVPKIIAVLLVIVVLFAWMSNMLGEYTRNLFEMIPRIARM